MKQPAWRRLARWSAWSLLVVILLLLTVTSSFWAYAAVRQTHAAEDVAPASGRYVQGGDVRIFVQENGPQDGPPVLLIHGTGAWSAIWQDTMDTLAAQGYHAIALDLPPFGFSEKPANGAYGTADQGKRIVGVMEALDLSNVTLVGHSFGSRATVEAALSAPGRVDRLVLADAALNVDPGAQKESAILRGVLAVRPARDLLVASTVENPLLTKALLQQLIHNKSAATDERVAMLQAPLVVEGLTRDAGLWLATFLAPEPPGLANDVSALARLPMPVLLLWGAEDTVTPPSRGEALAQLVPGARLVMLEGVGHIPHIEAPDAFDAALLAFLDGTRQ